jgi:pyridoxamine 5'-phosphate oxidase
MIKFINIKKEKPYLILKRKYDEALKNDQRNIEAIAISSFNKESAEVNSRLVNLKFIDGDEFIFFSNYKSPKSYDFQSHNQISALLYWSSINVQVRIKAKINLKSDAYNQEYFESRSILKNALAISSDQSKKIESYESVIKKYNFIKGTKDLKKCPSYWGGFSFIPYYFEFWEGNKNRLNKRDLYLKKGKNWLHSILEP